MTHWIHRSWSALGRTVAMHQPVYCIFFCYNFIEMSKVTFYSFLFTVATLRCSCWRRNTLCEKKNKSMHRSTVVWTDFLKNKANCIRTVQSKAAHSSKTHMMWMGPNTLYTFFVLHIECILADLIWNFHWVLIMRRLLFYSVSAVRFSWQNPFCRLHG